jgi:hypothetical protein
MLTVQIEHRIRDYDSWRAAFDRDPAGRQRSGVRSYRVFKPVADEHYVIIELDFDELERAEAFVNTMRGIWKQVEGTVMTGPQVRILDCIEQHNYE